MPWLVLGFTKALSVLRFHWWKFLCDFHWLRLGKNPWNSPLAKKRKLQDPSASPAILGARMYRGNEHPPSFFPAWGASLVTGFDHCFCLCPSSTPNFLFNWNWVFSSPFQYKQIWHQYTLYKWPLLPQIWNFQFLMSKLIWITPLHKNKWQHTLRPPAL